MAGLVKGSAVGPDQVRQGDVWWYEFAAPDKARPVLVLTRSEVTPYLKRVTVAPLTTKIRGLPTEVLLTLADGMDRTCAVTLDNIQTVAKAQMRGFVTQLSGDRMREVRAAVEFAFGFDRLV